MKRYPLNRLFGRKTPGFGAFWHEDVAQERLATPADMASGLKLDSSGLDASQLYWELEQFSDPPVVAVTPHGSYTFAVVDVRWNNSRGRVELALQEIDRA